MAYARAVVAKEIPACIFVIQACQRHLDDLRKSDDAHYEWRFDERKASRVCWFISQLPHTKGRWAKPVRGVRPKLILEAWQCFITCSIFGWVDKSTGLRRFSEVYIEVPRKNGKSPWAAGVGLHMFTGDGEEGAEVYSGATKRKQAMEVFRPARLMAKWSPKFLAKFDIEVNISSLTRPDESRFEPLVRNPGDGSAPSCAIIDEYHEHLSPVLLEAMQTGMAGRDQPILLVITTAGFNTGAPCYIMREDLIQVLAGTVQDDKRFGIIYTLDEGEDWRTEEAARKANPNFGVSVNAKFLRGQQDTAEKFAHKRNAILTKHFNLWQNQASAWIPPEEWTACADPTLDIRNFKGKPCWMGNDLAARNDLASRILIFKESRMDKFETIDGPTGDVITQEGFRDHYTLFGYHYAPSLTISDGDHPNYVQWEHEKFLISVPGVEIQLSRIQADIDRDAELYDMKAIAFDPWGAQQMQQDLALKYGDDIVLSVPQTALYFSDPMKEFASAVKSGRVHHNGDKLYAWALSNVQVKPGQNESMFPRKGKDEKRKIDPISATLTGFNRAYTAPAPRPSVYEERGILIL